MGLSNFFDNFICGLTFGMMANTPFFGGMGYGGYGNYSRVDFNTFANPFPCIFGNGIVSNTSSVPPILTTFANPNMPKIDFSKVSESIWESVKNLDIKSQISQVPVNYSYNTEVSFTETPFSQYYLPNSCSVDINTNPFYQYVNMQPQSWFNWLNPNQQETQIVEKTTKKQDEKIPDTKPVEKHKLSVKNKTSEQVQLKGKNYKYSDSDFNKMLGFVLGSEGGYSNDPDDRGGKTNKGITTATYNTYRQNKGLSTQSVKKITNEEVQEIYYEMYYKASGADKLSNKQLALYVFDTAVNMGVNAAKELLSASGGDLKKFEQLRRNRYARIIQRNPSQEKFKKGWNNRVTDLTAYAKNNFNSNLA